MRQDELSPAKGSKKDRKIVGRGNGSGHGRTAGRGDKGQKYRSGMTRRPSMEGGGVMPSLLRLPHKRGFTNVFRREYIPINLRSLNVFPDGTEVTKDALFSVNLIESPDARVKILGDGDLTKKLIVKVDAFSEKAKSAIESAGGKAEEV